VEENWDVIKENAGKEKITTKENSFPVAAHVTNHTQQRENG
jgi:hypothetical protein